MPRHQYLAPLLGSLFLLGAIGACGAADSSLSAPTADVTPRADVTPTADVTPRADVTPTAESPGPSLSASPTAAPTTAVPAPSITLRLGPGRYGHEVWLEVLDGEYQLMSGAIALAGSAIGVDEDELVFYPRMLIEVDKGGVTLLGKTYPEGTQLVTDASGSLSALK